MPRPRRDELIARYNFAIDHFQIEALVAEHFYPAVNDLGDLCTLIGVG